MSQEKRAVIVASSVSFFLVCIKIFASIITGSMAILASAIDSLLDMAMSLFNLFAVKKSEEEHDATYNYGQGKIEAFAGMVEGSLISISAGVIMYLSIDKYINESEVVELEMSLGLMAFVTVVTGALVLYLTEASRKSHSLVLKADALHYKTDVYTNLGIFLSLGLIYFTGFGVIDQIVSFAIGGYILYSAFGILKESYYMLMDHALDPELVEDIEKIIMEKEEIEGFHFLRTRLSGKVHFVDFHMVFKDPHISLMQAHTISDEVECAIGKRIGGENEVTIHLDPVDDSKSPHVCER
ncbi:MAG: cation diffusion facilitator family transporter [Patescibacteria group bacterium]|nr:cation diffusion facilitator family transporter [Patescibacteria group bacterium]